MNRPVPMLPRAALLALAITLGLMAVAAKDDPKTKFIELPEDNAMAKLKPGPGVETVEANCIGCHSTDYMVHQPGGDDQRWLEVVNKMVKIYGAMVSDEDAKVIADYLGAAYPPAPAKALPATKPRTRTRILKEKPQLH